MLRVVVLLASILDLIRLLQSFWYLHAVDVHTSIPQQEKFSRPPPPSSALALNSSLDANQGDSNRASCGTTAAR